MMMVAYLGFFSSCNQILIKLGGKRDPHEQKERKSIIHLSVEMNKNLLLKLHKQAFRLNKNMRAHLF